MSTERDTHFQGSARVLWQELYKAGDTEGLFLGYRPEFLQRLMEPLITQFLYDFAGYVLQGTTENELWMFSAGEEELEKIVPDLTEWPKPD